MNRFALLLIPLFLSASSWQDKINSGLQLATDSIQNTQGGYKDIVSRALEAAVKQLSNDGFIKSASAKIPLPGHLEAAANIAKKVGGEKWANELISEMNSAASSAVVGASVVFANAIKNMNEADVKQIISGGKDSFTSFLKKNSSTELERVFKPIIDEKMSKSSFATAYNSLSNLIPSNSENIKSIQNLVANFDKNGYMLKENEDLNSYITRKTLDGLFNVMSEKEDALRGDSVLNKLIK